MSPEEFANLPMQIVITFSEGMYKVAIMSATHTTDTRWYDEWANAWAFINAHAIGLRSS